MSSINYLNRYIWVAVVLLAFSLIEELNNFLSFLANELSKILHTFILILIFVHGIWPYSLIITTQFFEDYLLIIYGWWAFVTRSKLCHRLVICNITFYFYLFGVSGVIILYDSVFRYVDRYRSFFFDLNLSTFIGLHFNLNYEQ